MPATAGNKTYFTFIKGIVTEASPLIFPENASIDEDNFVLNRDGSRQRRLGVDYEDDYVLKDTGSTAASLNTAAYGVYKWNNVNNDPTLQFGVIQVGVELWFVDMFKDSLTSNFLNSGNAVTMSGTGVAEIQVSVINGDLIVTSKEFDPVYLSYDVGTDTVSSTAISFSLRDFFGVDDSLAINEHPATLSAEHEYNLLNQGWSSTNITAYKSSRGVYPSNADIMTLGKDSSDNFSASLLAKQFFGNTPAPKGRYAISAFTRGASRVAESGVAGLPVDSEGGRISTSAAFAGRVFYAGVASVVTSGDDNSPDYTGFVFFSKLVSKAADLGNCYQEADPTSEHISDLIATDGGYVQIPDATNIMRLVSTDKSLLVIAENGVWELVGNMDTGFSATEYQVNKISDNGATSAKSIVNVEGLVTYWSDGGVYALQRDTSNFFKAQNITATTIQTLYDGINGVAKTTVKGSFDPATRKISWLYNDDSGYDGVEFRNSYNRELIFDTILQAFYQTTIEPIDSVDTPYVAEVVITPNFNTADYVDQVQVSGVDVQENGNDVVITEAAVSRGESQTKYLTILPNSAGNLKFTFSFYRNGDFLDWETYDSTGVDYSSYLLTGYEIGGDSTKWKQVPYVTFHFNRTESGFEEVAGVLEIVNPSSCLVTSYWDFADHANSGKIGSQFQAYRYKRNYITEGAVDGLDYGQSVITTKNKLRGRGKALSLRIESEAGKDIHILGWGMPFLGGGSV